MVNGERLDVRIVTSTGADFYALGYSEAEFRRLTFQGEYLRDFTADVLRHAGIAPGMRVLDIDCGVVDVSVLVAEMVSSSGTVLGVDRSGQAVAVARQRAAAAGSQSPLYIYLADTLRSLLPMAERAGIATAAEIAIETMAERLRKEAVENNACIMPPPLVGAWTRLPAATGIAIGYQAIADDG